MTANRTSWSTVGVFAAVAAMVLSVGTQRAAAHPPACPSTYPSVALPASVGHNVHYQDVKQRLAQQHADQVRWIHREYSDQIRRLNRLRADAARLPQPYRAHRFAEIDQQKRDVAYVRKQRLAAVNHTYQSQREDLRTQHRLATHPPAQPLPLPPGAWPY
jgi:hypothetical protein